MPSASILSTQVSCAALAVPPFSRLATWNSIAASPSLFITSSAAAASSLQDDGCHKVVGQCCTSCLRLQRLATHRCCWTGCSVDMVVTWRRLGGASRRASVHPGAPLVTGRLAYCLQAQKLPSCVCSHGHLRVRGLTRLENPRAQGASHSAIACNDAAAERERWATRHSCAPVVPS